MKILYIGLMSGTNGFTKALRNVCDQYAEVAIGDPGQMSHEICHLLDSFQPTIVFIQIQNYGLTAEVLKKLRASTAYVINWTGDVRYPIPEFYFQYAPYVDVTSFSNMTDVKTFRQYGYKTEYLQIGYDQEIYTPEGEAFQVEDIVFMGNNTRGFPLSTYRAEMVQFLKRHYGSRFGVYGNNWDSLTSGNYNGQQHGEASVYRGAKIAINCSHFNYERYSSDRLFRALGCGVCVLSHNYQQIENDFIPDKHLVIWDDFDGLKEQIDHLLTYEYVAMQISQRGLEHNKKYFTFDAMAQNIIKIWESR